MAVTTGILPRRYRRPQLIGRGGMGDIYRATDSVLGRDVAIKILAERFAEDDAVRSRFTREALAAARLSGERNAVTIFDVGEHDRRPYIVMEYLGGGSLDEVVRKSGPQPPQQAFTWIEQAARALDAAHASGVVHRDVKPANLLLDRDGNVHVADFGIASAAGMDSLTATGTVLGTAGYFSPEQAQGQRANAATDRYSLAVVAFELLTGTRPFAADSPTAEAAAHVNAPVPSVSARSELPPEVDAVFEQALAKDPSRRFATCSAFVAALRDAVAGAPMRAAPGRRRTAARSWPLLAALLAVGLLAGGLLAAVLTHGGSGRGASSAPRVITSVQTVTTAAPPSQPSGTSGEALNLAGYRKMQAGDLTGALPLLEEAVRKLDGTGKLDEAYAMYNLAYTRYHLGNCDGVRDLLDQAEAIEGHKSAIDRLRAQADSNC